MRLIDADALCARIENEFDGVCVYDVSGNEAAREFCDMVDVAPTIDAIPVGWLRKKRVTHPTTDAEILHNSVIRAVLVMWEREQEAR